MDQLKKQLEVVAEYGFWIGSAIVLLGSVAVWYLSTSDLSVQSKKQIGKITGDVQKIANMRSEMSKQPNQKSHDVMQQMIDSRLNEVLTAWSSIYQDQRPILTWPKTPEIPEKYINEFRYLRDPDTNRFDTNKQKLPYEKYVSYPITEEQKVPNSVLQNYARYIGRVLPDLAAIAKAEWTADFERKSSGYSGGMAEGGGDSYDMSNMAGPKVSITGQEEGPLVVWAAKSQEAVLSDLFPWRGRRPDELQVYYSQENMWILKQLLEIVAAVNGDAQQAFEAKVREINQLAIGQSVKMSGVGSLDSPGKENAGMDMEDMYSMAGGAEGGDMYAEGGMSMGGAGGTATDPGDNRYVNTKLEQITGSQLRSALGSNSPNDAALAVAKRVPVMMSLRMDQRYVPKLLAECGSAALMVDVRQVRFMPKGKSSVSSSGMGGMGEGGEETESDDMGGSFGGASPLMKTKDEFPLDMDIEVYGLIYIYNPPNREALGVENVTEDTEVEGTKIGDTKNAAPAESSLPAPAAAPATPDPATPDPATPDPAAATPDPAAASPDPSATPDAGNATAPADGSAAPAADDGSGDAQPAAPDPSDGSTPPDGGTPADASATPPVAITAPIPGN